MLSNDEFTFHHLNLNCGDESNLVETVAAIRTTRASAPPAELPIYNEYDILGRPNLPPKVNCNNNEERRMHLKETTNIAYASKGFKRFFYGKV
jgi:hypothetical protein